MSCQEYFERVRNAVDVIKSLGGSIVDNMHLKDELPDREPRGGYNAEQLAGARARIENKTIAYGILVRADRSRYGKLIEEMENDFLKGNNDYPQTPTETYNLLVNYRNYATVNKRNAAQSGLDHVAFVTDGKRQRGDNKQYPHIKCFKCNQFGHYKSDCPEIKEKTGGESGSSQESQAHVSLTTLHVALTVARKEIDPMWILCDSESTVDIFKNKAMLVNIKNTRNPIRLKGLEGQTMDITQEGTLLGYGTVYYNPHVTANVLSFFNMAKRFKSIVYDNKESNIFHVTRDDDTVMEFRPSPEGLYYYDFNNSVLRQRREEDALVINTVEDLRRNYTNKELKKIEEARRLYVIMGRPSKEDFQKMLTSGKMLDNPVVMEDFFNAEKLYGTDLGVIKGKTVRKKPKSVPVDIQSAAVERMNIILAVDIMNFMGLSFLVTVSRNIRFITASMLFDRKKKTIVQALIRVFHLYRGKGHDVTDLNFSEQNQPVHTILGDNEFEAIREDMAILGVAVNITAREEHVPEIERQHRVIKERARAVIQTLPYRSVPRKMRIALIQNVVFWLNNIPKMGQDYSPRDLIFGEKKLNYKTLCRIPFGAYAQVHDDQSVTNTMESRTTGAISLGGTGNIQGTYKFLSLRSGEIIVRRTWTELPVPRDVIERVEELAINEPEYNDADDKNEEEVDEVDDNCDPEIAEEERLIDRNELGESGVIETENEKEENNQIDFNTEHQEQKFEQQEVDEQLNDDEKELTEAGPYDLRPNRIRDFSYRFAFLSVREGLRKFGELGRIAIVEELQLLLNEEVFIFMDSLTDEQKQRALRIHCFLTEKRDGRIKARAVADGRSQKRYLEEETYSPTVRLESIMLCSLIDALEQRYVATIDIKGAFLKAKVPGDL